MIQRIFLFVSLLAALATVFVTDSGLLQPAVTGKYFWFAAAMCGVALAACVRMCTCRLTIRWADVAVLLFALVVIHSRHALGARGDMQCWLFLLMIPLYVAVRAACVDALLQRRLLHAVLAATLAESLWGLLQLYSFTPSYHHLYRITGSLFNPGPYSGFVAVGVPLALSYALNRENPRRQRWLGGITLLAALLVLPATGSRAAWLAALAGSIPVLWNKWQPAGYRLPMAKTKFGIVSLLVMGAIIAGMLAGMYHFKKDSADGRWLIWRVSAEMTLAHPVTGAGFGRFAAVYGDAQAAYFLAGKGTDAQAMIADSPEYAFNEYMRMAVELGLLGLLCFALMIALCLLRSRTFRPSSGGMPSTGGALTAFLVFATFSYPFGVLPLCILFVVLLAVRASSSQPLASLPAWVRIAGVAVCLCITAYSAYHILPRRTAYREWTSLQPLYHACAYDEALREYRDLNASLYYEKQFLFEMGQCFSKTGHPAESNRLFEEYLDRGSDPMAYNCMGNNYRMMRDYEAAERMYLRASQIVPNRHYPFYLLMKLYDETGQREKAIEMAQILLNKPVKVSSTAIREMQMEAKKIKSNKK
jgi:O-antigen ligase